MKGRIATEAITKKLGIIGRIKIGETYEKDGKTIPRSLDYFKAQGNFSNIFHEAYGPEPRELKIIFLSDVLEDVCNEYFSIRKGPRLYAEGDGEVFNVWNKDKEEYETIHINSEPGVMERVRKECSTPKLKAEWTHSLTLRFGVLGIRGVSGVWQFTTRGEESSIKNIIGVFDQVQGIVGTVIFVPFYLTVEKVESQKMGDKKVFPVVSLTPGMSLENLAKIGAGDNPFEALRASFIQNELSGPEAQLKITDSAEDHPALPEAPVPEASARADTPAKKRGDFVSAVKAINESKSLEATSAIREKLEKREWTKSELKTIELTLQQKETELKIHKEFGGQQNA